jgi:Tfp pilus assembly protein PilW
MLIRLGAEDGFSLTELLAAMIIGIVIIFGAFTVIDNSATVNGKVVGRTDATQRGRAAMDEITRALRSAVCANNTPPITTATPTQVVFTVDLSDGSGVLPEQRQLTYSPTADTITQSVVAGSGTTNAVQWVATAKTRTLLTDSDPDPATTPTGAIFTYWKFSPGTAGQTLVSLGSTVAAADLSRIARIDIAYVTRPANVSVIDARAANVEDAIAVRSVNPDTTDPKTTCA